MDYLNTVSFASNKNTMRIKSLSKISLVVLIAICLCGSFMMIPFRSSAAELIDGDLIRNSNAVGMAQFDVYIIKIINGKRFKRLIISPHVFESYGHFDKNKNGNPWDDIINVDQATIDLYQVSELVKSDSDNKIYRLSDSNFSDMGERELLGESYTEVVDLGYDIDSVYIINAFDRDHYSNNIVWNEGTAVLSVNDVQLGNVAAPGDLLRLYGNGDYLEGETIHALVLSLKVKTSEESENISLNIRRKDNQDNLHMPNTKQFKFASSGGTLARANNTFYHDIYFVVPENEETFDFVSGGNDNIPFSIRVFSDGSFSVFNE